MSEEMIRKSVSEKFPHFNESEQELLFVLLSDSNAGSSRFDKAKEEFLKILYNDLVRFYKWDVQPDKRIAIRRRLLNVSNIFVIIPIKELREIAHRAKLTLKKIVNESASDPLNKDISEVHSYDIKYVDRFANFFAKIDIEPHLNSLDYIAGNRERRQHPRSQFTVFLKNIQDEVIANEYLTASAEPLTQTQLVSLCMPDGTYRDLFTIGFDMIFESAFIDYFHNAPDITPVTLLRNAHIMGKRFLHAAIDQCVDLMKKKANLLEELPMFLTKEEDSSKNRINDLLTFLLESLIPQTYSKIAQWNKDLGLDKDNEQIHWEKPKGKN